MRRRMAGLRGEVRVEKVGHVCASRGGTALWLGSFSRRGFITTRTGPTSLFTTVYACDMDALKARRRSDYGFELEYRTRW
jgi:hypothetical protein